MITAKFIFNIINKKGVIRNFSILSFCNVLTQLVGIFINIKLAREMAPSLFGQYGVLIALVQTFLVISSLGLQNVIIRGIARSQSQSKRFFYASLFVKACGFVFATILLIIYQYCISTDISNNFIILLLILSLLSFGLWDELQNVAFGMEQMEFTGYINVIINVLLIGIFYVMPSSYFTVEKVYIIYIISQFMKVVLLLFCIKQQHLLTGTVPKANKKAFLKDLVSQGTPFYILALCSMLSIQFPVLFLGANAGDEQVAFYNTANKLLQPMNLVVTTALSALFPNLSKLFLNDKKRYFRHIMLAFSYLTGFGIIFAFMSTLFRNEIIFLLYGVEYGQAGNVWAYQSWYFVMLALFSFIGTILASADKQKLLSVLSVFYALISVPIIWIGSTYGAESLSISFLIASVVNMSYHWYFLNKTLSGLLTKKFTYSLFITILLSFSISLLIPNESNLFFRLALFVIICMTLLLVVVRKFKKQFNNQNT